MKFIFLDFDGVLNSSQFRETTDDYHNNFIDQTRLPFLKKIIDETRAKIVLTTTWRLYWNGNDATDEITEKINAPFKKHGMEIYSRTDDYGENRDYEIAMWLCNHGADNYVILDDVDFRWSMENRRHFLKTDDSAHGLDEITAAHAIEILNSDLY